jgi:hypothetical protein
LRGLKATLHHAITLNECYQQFWQSPNVLEMLNHDIALTMARFSENTLLGNAINHALEQAGETLRVIVTMPNGYAFENGQFTYSPPVSIEPAPIENDP